MRKKYQVSSKNIYKRAIKEWTTKCDAIKVKTKTRALLKSQSNKIYKTMSDGLTRTYK